MPFSKWATKLLRHNCDAKDRRLSRDVGHYFPQCDAEGIMDWITFADLFAEEFHGCHIMNECDYLNVGYQAKQNELEWRNNRRSLNDLESAKDREFATDDWRWSFHPILG